MAEDVPCDVGFGIAELVAPCYCGGVVTKRGNVAMCKICPLIFQCKESKKDAGQLKVIYGDGPFWIFLGDQRGLNISRTRDLSQKGGYRAGATGPYPSSSKFAHISILDEGRRLLDELKDGSGMEGHALNKDTPICQGLFKDMGDGDGVGGLL